MGSLANNWLDFEMNEKNFETSVVVAVEMEVVVEIDYEDLIEFFLMIY
jgi:hypothetical protein